MKEVLKLDLLRIIWYFKNVYVRVYETQLTTLRGNNSFNYIKIYI